MSALAEKLRKARTLTVEIASGVSVFVLRPTPFEYAEKLRGPTPAKGLASLLTGWDGVTELFLTGTGAPHPLPFDQEAAAEWLFDHPTEFRKVMDAVIAAYTAYIEQQELAAKN